MSQATLSELLEREHHEIDAGIEAYTSGAAGGGSSTEPLVRAIGALRRHIYLEEEFVFPPLRAAGMVPSVFVMLREHGEIWTTMAALESELASDVGPEATVATCQRLLEQLQTHNAKEEPIIYPQADAVLDADSQSRLRDFVASGEMPEGWVAERARG